jgi:hypothetical protein
LVTHFAVGVGFFHNLQYFCFNEYLGQKVQNTQGLLVSKI